MSACQVAKAPGGTRHPPTGDESLPWVWDVRPLEAKASQRAGGFPPGGGVTTFPVWEASLPRERESVPEGRGHDRLGTAQAGPAGRAGRPSFTSVMLGRRPPVLVRRVKALLLRRAGSLGRGIESYPCRRMSGRTR